MKKQTQLKNLFLIFSFILINNSQALSFRCVNPRTTDYYEINLTFKNIGSEKVYLDNVSLSSYNSGGLDRVLDTNSPKKIIYSPRKSGYINLHSIESPEPERGFFKWDLTTREAGYNLHIYGYPSAGLMLMVVCKIDQEADGYGMSFGSNPSLSNMIKNTKAEGSEKYKIYISSPIAN